MGLMFDQSQAEVLKPIVLQIRRNRYLALQEMIKLAGRLDSRDETIMLVSPFLESCGKMSIGRIQMANGRSWNAVWSPEDVWVDGLHRVYETIDLKYTLWWLRRMCL